MGKKVTLRRVLRDLLCPMYREKLEWDEEYQFWRGECQCPEPRLQKYYCAYGDCMSLVCERCGKTRWAIKGKCYFPYT